MALLMHCNWIPSATEHEGRKSVKYKTPSCVERIGDRIDSSAGNNLEKPIFVKVALAAQKCK